MDFSARLRECRSQAGLTQDQVAEALGIYRSALSLMESGKQGVPSELLRDICKLYHVSADWLLTGQTRSASAV